VSGESGRDERI